MSRCGMSVITVIHQPRYSIFQAFDDVMLLGKGGKLVYLGPSTLALPYLQMLGFVLPPNENPVSPCSFLIEPFPYFIYTSECSITYWICLTKSKSDKIPRHYRLTLPWMY